MTCWPLSSFHLLPGRFMRTPMRHLQVASTLPLPMGSPAARASGVVHPLAVVLDVGERLVDGPSVLAATSRLPDSCNSVAMRQIAPGSVEQRQLPALAQRWGPVAVQAGGLRRRSFSIRCQKSTKRTGALAAGACWASASSSRWCISGAPSVRTATCREGCWQSACLRVQGQALAQALHVPLGHAAGAQAAQGLALLVMEGEAGGVGHAEARRPRDARARLAWAAHGPGLRLLHGQRHPVQAQADAVRALRHLQGPHQGRLHVHTFRAVQRAHRVRHLLEATAAVGQPVQRARGAFRLARGATPHQVRHGLGRLRQPAHLHAAGAQAHCVHRGPVASRPPPGRGCALPRPAPPASCSVAR